MREKLERFLHELLDVHFWTKWYYWGKVWKRRHCKYCVITHDGKNVTGVVPYQTKEGWTEVQSNEVGNDYQKVEDRILFPVEKLHG